MNTDKTLEDKIYRVLLIHGQNSKEIAKMIRKEIEVLKEKYKKEIEKKQLQIDSFYEQEEPTRDKYKKIRLDRMRIEKDKNSIEIGVFYEVLKDLGELLK